MRLVTGSKGVGFLLSLAIVFVLVLLKQLPPEAVLKFLEVAFPAYVVAQGGEDGLKALGAAKKQPESPEGLH